MDTIDILRDRAESVYSILRPLWPRAKPLLNYETCFELLCAVILSAQCTDEQVNKVTPALFARWPGPSEMAEARPAELARVIHSVGFYKTKAEHLIASAKILRDEFDGTIPRDMELMLRLPGVGRKTANLVLSACYGLPGIIVDTHVLRTSLRLGFCGKPDPGAVEAMIAQLVPKRRWTAFSHALNRHGKQLCTARKPACIPDAGLGPCPLARLCPRIGLGQFG